MREFLTDKNFIESKILVFAKILLIAALIIFFLPLLILPFFNHPFADDYFCGYQLYNKGFIPYQLFIYTNWGGRFGATFTGSLFAYNNFLYSHYYFHSLLLLTLNYFSILFLINTVYKFILKESSRLLARLLLSLLFLALEICSVPEISTFNFWFSSAITYQLPVILIQIEIALFIIYYNSNNKLLRNACAVLLPALVFITIGFSELFIIVQLLLFGIAFYFKDFSKFSAAFIVSMAFAFLAAGSLLFFAPGNQVRMTNISSKSISTGIAAVVYESLQTLWNIFKDPFFWFASVAVLLYANRIKSGWGNNLYVKKISKKLWLLPLIIIAFLLACISLPVVALKGGMLPERYLNAVVCCMLLLLLSFFFITGLIINSKILSLRYSIQKILLYIFFIIGLLCNSYITNAYKSLVIAPVYNNILNERETVLKQAAKTNKVAAVKDYNTSLSELLQTKYNKSTATFQQLIKEKPPLLFFEDDLSDEYSIDILKKYYMLDSIVVEKK